MVVVMPNHSTTMQWGSPQHATSQYCFSDDKCIGFLRSSLAHVMRVRVFSLAPRHWNFEKPACFTNLRTTSASQDKHSTCSSCEGKSNKATLTLVTNILVVSMSKYLVSHNVLTYKQRPRALNTTSQQAWYLPHPSIKALVAVA